MRRPSQRGGEGLLKEEDKVLSHTREEGLFTEDHKVFSHTRSEKEEKVFSQVLSQRREEEKVFSEERVRFSQRSSLLSRSSLTQDQKRRESYFHRRVKGIIIEEEKVCSHRRLESLPLPKI